MESLEEILAITGIGTAFMSFSISFLVYVKIMMGYLEGRVKKREDFEKKFRDMRNEGPIGFIAYYCSIPGRHLAYRDFELE